MSSTSRISRKALRLLVPLGALALGLLGTSCDGNVSCIFTTGCQDNNGGGGVGADPATLPLNGEWVVDARPAIVGVFPDASILAHGTTPIVVTFSESMAGGSLFGAIEIVPIINGFPTDALPGLPQSLLGNGRLLVILPPTPLMPGEYLVRLSEDATASDLTGQRLDFSPGADLGTFAVAGTNPDTPRVVAGWPRDAGVNESETSEIVVVFDRAMDEDTVNDASFEVTADGADPAFDPPAEALTVSVMGFPVSDTRVFLYQSVNDDGDPVSLGTSANVLVNLSGGADIEDEDGNVLPETPRSFTTNTFSSPLSAQLMSPPTDSFIGLANLVAGMDEVSVNVDLFDAADGDRLDLFLFGTNRDPDAPQLIALLRSIELVGAPMQATFTLADLDLLTDASDPASTRFADGPVAFALRMRRGSVVSPLRLLDVDAMQDLIQDPILDTSAPVVTELLFPGGDTMEFASDVRDLVILGRADEPVEFADVTTMLGSNTSSAVLGSDSQGFFVTSPVLIDVVDQADLPLDFTLTVADAAGNTSDPINGTFRQYGVVNGAAHMPGDSIVVEVYDARTLQPIADARVMTHGDEDDGVNYPFADGDLTDVDGLATLMTAGAPSVETILTVDADGYDLFTFHGVTAARVSIPLRVSGGIVDSAGAGGTITTTNGTAAFALTTVADVKIGDTRRLDSNPHTYDADPCNLDPFSGGASCEFGTEAILPDRVGAQSVIAGTFQQDELTFLPQVLIQGFDFTIPTQPTEQGEGSRADAEIPYVFTDPSTPFEPEEVPVELTSVSIGALLTTGIDLGNLDGDPLTTGDPRVTIESVVPGIAGALPVGMGLAFPAGASAWTVRSAVPGAVTAAGELGMNGIVDTDFFVRAEIRDIAGNRAGARPRFSALPPFNALLPGNVPTLISPGDGGSTGAPSYVLEIDNAIGDVLGQPGLYRVDLIDGMGGGRRWTLWRPDTTGGANVRIRVPDPTDAGLGGGGLAAGGIDCRVSSFAWPSLNGQEFLWSDVEREYDIFAQTATVTFTQDP